MISSLPRDALSASRDMPVTRALSLAVVLGLLGSSPYAVVVRGQSLFHKLTGLEILTVLALIAVLWLILWPIFAAEPWPERPPRPIAEMTRRSWPSGPVTIRPSCAG